MDLVTPSGFRDVLAEEAVERERITQGVQRLFAGRGYLPIETPTLEVMDVMRAGGHLPGSPFKFFDSQGDLLAMRPDVTLQVARMCATRLANEEGPLRFRYRQRVFREAESATLAEAREVTQMGIECIGESGPQADAEVIGLMSEALKIAGVNKFSLAVATVGVLRALLERSGAPARWKARVLDAYHSSNFVELDRLTALDSDDLGMDVSAVAPAYAAAIRALSRIRGGREAIERVRELVAPLGCLDGLDDFECTYDLLAEAGLAGRILVDFSVMSSFDYYTGIVFEAYSPYLGTSLGSGGRYDNMIGAYGESRPAAGFAFTLEQAMAASASGEREGRGQCSVAQTVLSSRETSTGRFGSCGTRFVSTAPDLDSRECMEPQDTVPQAAATSTRSLRIAVPKGALNVDTIKSLAAAGLDTTGLENPGRQLVISNPGVDYVIVRPTDAPIFVALGAADCGICGKDSLLEAAPDVVELVDLKFGGCRFVVAEPEDAGSSVEERYRTLGSIRVATKYPRITKAHYARTGTQVDIVKLHGNIELAPLTGMAERIVDITATGTTLRENNLRIVEEVLASTARFFANTCAFRTDERIVKLAQALAGYVADQVKE